MSAKWTEEMDRALELDRQKLISLGCDPGPEWCEHCSGNGEIITDWDLYLCPPAGGAGDVGTAACRACDGTGLAHSRAALAKAGAT